MTVYRQLQIVSHNIALQQVVLHAQCIAGHAAWTEIKFIHIYSDMQSESDPAPVLLFEL